jgi:hypothetical protein
MCRRDVKPHFLLHLPYASDLPDLVHVLTPCLAYCFTLFCPSVRMSHFCDRISSYISRRSWTKLCTKQEDDGLDVHEEQIFGSSIFFKSYGPLHLNCYTILSCERNSYISRRIWTKLDTKQGFYGSSIFARVMAVCLLSFTTKCRIIE